MQHELFSHKQAVVQFLHESSTRELLHRNEAVWLAHYGELKELDIGFYSPSQGGSRELVRLSFQGIENCVGICVPHSGESDEAFNERLARVEQTIQTYYPALSDDFVIVVGNQAAVQRWRELSIQSDQEIHEELTTLAARETSPYASENRRVDHVHQLFTTQLTTEFLGVAERGKMQFLFVNPLIKTDNIAAAVSLIPVQNVKRMVKPSNKEGAVYTEEVLSEALCAGIYVPPIESIITELVTQHPELADDPVALTQAVKNKAYTTAEYIRRSLVPYTPPQEGEQQPRFHVAVAFDDQLELWERFGFFGKSEPYRPGAPSPHEVETILYHGEKGAFTGPLVSQEIILQRKPVVVEGIDYLFYKYDEAMGAALPIPLPLVGFDRNLELTEYDDVVGLVCFPEAMSFVERKKETRRLEALLRRWFNQPSYRLLGVDNRLLQLWQERGTPLLSPQELQSREEKASPKDRINYLGAHSVGGVQNASVVLFEKKQQIGGNQIALSLEYEGGTKRVSWLDFGWPYSAEPVLSTFPARPSFELGIRPYLDAGIVPHVRRLFRTDLLKMSLDYQCLEAALSGSSFIASELYHRLGWNEFKAWMQERVPQFDTHHFSALKKQLEATDQRHYSDKVIYDGMFLTHAHVDHHQALSLVRFDIGVGATPATAAFLQTFYKSGWHYTAQEFLTAKDRFQPKVGGSYPTKHRPVWLFNNGESRRINPHLDITSRYVNHSILGTTAWELDIFDNERSPLSSIAYTGDLRSGPLTNSFIENMANKGPHVLIIEGTNLDTEDKPSAGFAESDVLRNIRARRIDADKKKGVFIVQLPQNHIERLWGVIETSGNRTVCVSFAMAQILHEFAIVNQSLPAQERVPIPTLGDHVIIFKHPKADYAPWEKQLMQTYGNIDMNDLYAHPTAYTLTLSPYYSLRNLFSSFVHNDVSNRIKGDVVRSTYWPYSPSDKAIVLSNARFCKELGFDYHSDIDLSRNRILVPREPIGYHASGHATNEQLLEYIHAMAQSGNLHTIIPLHTLHRAAYSSQIGTFLKQKGVNVYPDEGGIRFASRVKKFGHVVDIPLK